MAPLPAVWAEATGQTARDGVHYPVASNEVEFAFRWAAASGLLPVSDLTAAPWAIGGASAGANLATGRRYDSCRKRPGARAHRARLPDAACGTATPDAALRALLDADPTADRFGPAVVLDMYENYLGGAVDDAEVYAVPGLATAEQLRGFPATLIVNSESDELRVSGEAFAAALRSAGVDVTAVTELDTQHGHLKPTG